MTGERNDDETALDAFDREMRELLRVEPSADFLGGVRARMGERRPGRVRWTVLVPALAAGLGAVYAARVLMRPAPPVVAPRQPAVARQEPPSPWPVATSLPPKPVAARTRAAALPSPRPPEVIVDPGQEQALLSFVASVNAPGASAPASLTASASLDTPLMPPPPLEIAPLEAPGSDS